MVKLVTDKSINDSLNGLTGIHDILSAFVSGSVDKEKAKKALILADKVMGELNKGEYTPFSFEAEIEKNFIAMFDEYDIDEEFEIDSLERDFYERALMFDVDLCLYTSFLNGYIDDDGALGEAIAGSSGDTERVFAEACLSGFLKDKFGDLFNSGLDIMDSQKGAVDEFKKILAKYQEK